jgi:hypothetical protein
MFGKNSFLKEIEDRPELQFFGSTTFEKQFYEISNDFEVKPAQIAFGDLRLAFSFSIQYNT